MKFLCLLFSFYVMLLSAKPCCTDQDCDVKNTVVKKDLAENTPCKEKECAGCSPFFSCGSCVGFIAAKPVMHTLNFFAEMLISTYTPYQQPGLKEISLSIWQPPQLI